MQRMVDGAVMSGMEACPENQIRVSGRRGRCGIFQKPGGCCVDKEVTIPLINVKASQGPGIPKLWSWSNLFGR